MKESISGINYHIGIKIASAEHFMKRKKEERIFLAEEIYQVPYNAH